MEASSSKKTKKKNNKGGNNKGEKIGERAKNLKLYVFKYYFTPSSESKTSFPRTCRMDCRILLL